MGVSMAEIASAVSLMQLFPEENRVDDFPLFREANPRFVSKEELSPHVQWASIQSESFIKDLKDSKGEGQTRWTTEKLTDALLHLRLLLENADPTEIYLRLGFTEWDDEDWPIPHGDWLDIRYVTDSDIKFSERITNLIGLPSRTTTSAVITGYKSGEHLQKGFEKVGFKKIL